MSNNAHELSNRLLNALDNNYNVVDMHAVNEIISILERFNITKELLETTRLGKHVNELRRKTTEPTLARRAKVLVKRWRDLVIPTTTSPGHTGSNRSSAERQVRRLAGTPLTSPALSRQVVSPAVPSPRTASRPAWGGYESDSQDVILVDDDPPPGPIAPLPPALTAPSVKRPLSPQPLHDEKKAKRDKKPKKRRGHGRAGGTEAVGGVAAPGGPAGAGGGSAGGGPAAGGPAAGGPWGARNGAAHAERRNGCHRDALEPYAALVNKLPPLGAKKVKTTQELLAQIQSRGSRPPPARAPSPSPPASPASPASPDVMLIEPDPSPVAGSSPLRNGACSPAREAEAAAEAGAEAEAEEEAEEEEELEACTCGAEALAACPAARRREVRAMHVRALHHCLVAGLNGTRAPPRPPPPAARPARPAAPPSGLFASVVPLYRYCDYSDDYSVKNMSQVPLCPDLPWLIPDPPAEKAEPPAEKAEPSEAPAEGETEPLVAAAEVKAEIPEAPAEAEREPPSPPSAPPPPALAEGGRGLVQLCAQCSSNVPYTYRMMAPAPVMAMPRDEEQLARALAEAAEAAAEAAEAEERPPRPARFAEWHEAACLPRGLTALPYVVLD